MNILITGSHGRIGKIISKDLAPNHKLIRIDKVIDKENEIYGVDILKSPKIFHHAPYTETVIHLAANPNPFITEEDGEAQKNIEIARKTIEGCEQLPSLTRIINTSSINVYPYISIYENGEILTDKTPLQGNPLLGDGSYGRAKIQVERLFEDYCKQRRISLINMRLGHVTPDNKINDNEESNNPNPVDYDIHLKHKDLTRIVRESLKHKGINSYVCVSERDGFVNKSINFPSS